MSLSDPKPEPPEDDEQRSVIDKLASFVARNGLEFENMTKEKQDGNPQFVFLFGGEYSEYYLSKVEEIRKTLPSQLPMQPRHSNFHSESGTPLPPWGGGPPFGAGWGDDPGGPWPPPHQGNWASGGPSWPPTGPPGWDPYGAPPPHFYPHVTPQPLSGPPPLSEEDIKRSEDNLGAQYDKIMGEEKPAALRRCQDEGRLEAFSIRARALNITPADASAAIQPLIELCTKENIAKGKNWVVEQMSKSVECADLVADYLLARVAFADASFELRLHIVYLLNDLLHFLKRRTTIPHFTDAINRVVVPIFCFAMELADEAKQSKLKRVLTLWETNSYVQEDVLKNMKETEDREAFMKDWHEEQSKAFAEKIAKIEAEHQTRYEGLKKQHDEFAEHVRNTLAAKVDCNPSDPDLPPPFPDFSRFAPPPPPLYGPWGSPGFDQRWSESRGPPPPYLGAPPPPHPGRIGGGPGDRWDRHERDDMPPYRHHPYPDDDMYDGGRRGLPFRGPPRDRHRRDGPPGRYEDDYRDDRRRQRRSRYSEDHDGDANEPEPSSRWSESRRSSRSRDSPRGGGGVGGSSWHRREVTPPTASPPTPVTEEDLIPKSPFWQLPAALMVPLIKACDFEFTPLDPSLLRLLPPEPPREQLMQALDAYYAAPTHDRPRDAEGWERLGLFEFFREKEEARSRKDSGVDEVTSAAPSSPTPKKSNGVIQLAYLTAYPKSAIGQAIRTGPAALIGIPPPTMLLPKMNAQFAAAAAAAAAAVASSTKGGRDGKFENQSTTAVPPPAFMGYPPPPGGTTQQPTTLPAPPTQLIARTTFNSVRRRSRSYSRSPRSRSSRSRSDSRSRSRSRGSRGSRSSSRSRSRSRSSSPSRWKDRSRSRSSSPRGTRGHPVNRERGDGSITTAGFLGRGGGGGGERGRGSRRGADYPPWDFDGPPPPMMSAFDRPAGRGMRGGPPPHLPGLGHPPPTNQMFPPYVGGVGGVYRGNGYGGSLPPPPMGAGHRGSVYYGGGEPGVGGNPYGNGGRRGGGYQGR